MHGSVAFTVSRIDGIEQGTRHIMTNRQYLICINTKSNSDEREKNNENKKMREREREREMSIDNYE